MRDLYYEPRWVQGDPLPPRRILGIDIENQPLWYGGGDFVYDRVNCVSYKWVNDPAIHTIWLDWRQDDDTLLQLLRPLREAIEAADALLGHNFQHDWRGLQTTFIDLRQPFLVAPDIIDTMRSLPSGTRRGLEPLCDLLGVGTKPHVSSGTWVAAVSRNDPDAILTIRLRNREDVALTELLYHKERELGWIA